nr:beta-glucosidase 18-like isoform X1 [Ipomoea batatas]
MSWNISSLLLSAPIFCLQSPTDLLGISPGNAPKSRRKPQKITFPDEFLLSQYLGLTRFPSALHFCALHGLVSVYSVLLSDPLCIASVSGDFVTLRKVCFESLGISKYWITINAAKLVCRNGVRRDCSRLAHCRPPFGITSLGILIVEPLIAVCQQHVIAHGRLQRLTASIQATTEDLRSTLPKKCLQHRGNAKLTSRESPYKKTVKAGPLHTGDFETTGEKRRFPIGETRMEVILFPKQTTFSSFTIENDAQRVELSQKALPSISHSNQTLDRFPKLSANMVPGLLSNNIQNNKFKPALQIIVD